MATSRRQIREWVAGKLGRYHEVQVSVDGCDATLYDVVGLSEITADDERLQDSYLMLRDGSALPEWRRITATNLSNEQISINRAFDVTPPDGTSAAIYGLLDIAEWNGAINDALTELHFADRYEIEITTTVDANGHTVRTREYELPTWMTKGQVRSVRYRDLVSKREEDVPRFRLNEALGSLTLVLLDNPPPPTQFTIIVEAFRYHSRLDADDWGTTCPQPLWQSAVEVAVIHKIVKKYGDRFKRTFAMDLAIAERKLMEMRAKMLPTVITREYSTDDDWEGPDIDDFFSHDGWF